MIEESERDLGLSDLDTEVNNELFLVVAVVLPSCSSGRIISREYGRDNQPRQHRRQGYGRHGRLTSRGQNTRPCVPLA